jgi:hypothetical protein
VTERRRRDARVNAEDTFGAALNNMPDNYLQCRDIKHPWVITRDYHLVDASRDEDVFPRMGHNTYVRRELRCERCGKKRVDAYLISYKDGWQVLVRLNSSYADPDGFSVKGIGHLSGTAEMVRGEIFRRVLTKDL